LKTNDILKKLCIIEGLDLSGAYEVFKLSGYDLTKQRVSGYLSDDDSKEFLDCGYEALGSFLDGLIIHKRGESNSKKNDTPISLNNNLILKKLRIAYELKEVDLYEIFNSVEIDITKSELNSLFRREDHKNYRSCPDSILGLFLDGLEICEKSI
jgi:uncharacterized protein YehS (DUF1456 family)